MTALQVIAVDWSGRRKRASEAIWLACARGGRLLELENGRDRDEVIDEIVARGRAEPRTVVGLDFAFSFPRWFCEQQAWGSARAAWQAMADDGDALLEACEPPLWGRPGTFAQTVGDPYRATDAGGAKSVFQIGGAGAVGTGSIRGMACLLRLADSGFAVWPFDPPALPVVVEIYPRLLTGKVDKSRHRVRRDYLERCFPDQDPLLRERAAGSEDAFDAAVSALVMTEHADALERLPAFPPDAPQRIEGAIWSASP